jgi:hypothetical protein
MRRFRILTIAAAMTAVLAAATIAAVPAGAITGASCQVTWGSLPKSAPGGYDPLVGVRAGRHACYDRLVIDVRGVGLGGGGVRDVHYGAVYTQGQGLKLALAGGASLDITLSSRNYNIDTGAATYQPADPAHVADVAGFDTFRQVAYGGSFEGYSTIGLGVRARFPFRVFVLPGPGADSRLVIDVAHRW